MPLGLDDFRAISNGKYNAGQIDFETNRHGEVTGLRKVNNHVHMTGKNIVAIDPKRAVAVKEAFVKALADGGVSVGMALNEVIDAKAPSDNDFETETAAEIFADIVIENIDAVKKSFSGLIGKGRIAVAFKNAEKDDANHQHDGHKKVTANKL